MSENQDSEITLGTGRLLALFFGLVILCALFFSLGFSLGRKSAAPTAQAASAPVTLPLPAATSSAPKPSPGKLAEVKADCATPGECPQQASGSTTDELTFYKAVEQNEAKPQLQPAVPTAAASAPAKTDVQKAPEVSKPISLGPGYIVQVAAVSKQEDAEALVNALRRKNYPVISTNNPPSDKLFHVQVGPFAELKDAEATRAKLISDGYNPILKK